MPRIFDNIETSLLPALKETLHLSDHADFCVGYFNLRGWKQIDRCIDDWSGGDGHCCRLLVGMQRLPQEELRDALRIVKGQEGIDNQTALRLKKKLAEEFREQLMIGMPTEDDEAGLRRLAAQIQTYRKPLVTPGEVAQLLKVTHQSASSLIHDFEKLGILKRWEKMGRSQLYAFGRYLALFLERPM